MATLKLASSGAVLLNNGAVSCECCGCEAVCPTEISNIFTVNGINPNDTLKSNVSRQFAQIYLSGGSWRASININTQMQIARSDGWTFVANNTSSTTTTVTSSFANSIYQFGNNCRLGFRIESSVAFTSQVSVTIPQSVMFSNSEIIQAGIATTPAEIRNPSSFGLIVQMLDCVSSQNTSSLSQLVSGFRFGLFTGLVWTNEITNRVLDATYFDLVQGNRATFTENADFLDVTSLNSGSGKVRINGSEDEQFYYFRGTHQPIAASPLGGPHVVTLTGLNSSTTVNWEYIPPAP